MVEGTFFSEILYLYQFELFFLFSICFLLCFMVTLSNKKFESGYFKPVDACINMLILSTILLVLILIQKDNSSVFYYFGGFYLENYSTIVIKFLILGSFLVYLLIYKFYNSKTLINDFEFLLLTYIVVFSSCILVNSNDLLSFFFSLELQSLSLYILVASRQNSSFSTEAALKYFIMGSFSSGLILFGISLLYGFTGLYNFDDLSIFSSFFYECNLNLVFFGFLMGLVFFMVGVFFKLGAVPFHMWMPDVYDGSPMLVLAFVSLIPKISIIYIFFNLCYYVFFALFFFYQLSFVYVAIFSIVLGSVAAIYQIKLKRMLTYSMIANTGYLVLLLSLNDISGIYAMFFYIAFYFLTMLGLFITFILFKDWSTGQLVKKVTNFTNIFETNPVLAISVFILLFSISGIPPLLGFYPKLILFLFVLKQKMYLVSIIFLLFSAISVFYYIRLVKLSYFNRSSGWIFLEPPTYYLSLLLGVIILLNCILFLNPSILFNISLNFSFYWYV